MSETQNKELVESLTGFKLQWIPTNPFTDTENKVEAVEPVLTNINRQKVDKSNWCPPKVDVSNSYDDESLKPNSCITKFFDFYVLSLLNYFAGPSSLNHENRARRINEAYETSVEEMYAKIRRALEYSVIREFRHFGSQAKAPHDNTDPVKNEEWSRLMKVCKNCDDWYEEGILSKYLSGEDCIEVDRSLINDLCAGYLQWSWDCSYGGKLWGVATEFLRQNPKNIQGKELWVDRVLDLHHNNGHLLNKTEFNYLSNSSDDSNYHWDGEFSNERNPKRKLDLVEYNALDYRREAPTLSDLSLYASTKVRNLSTANMRYIPAEAQ